MASGPFIHYKPGADALALPSTEESASDSAVEAEGLKQRKGAASARSRRKENEALKEKSVVIVNISSALDGCDDQLLPATFRSGRCCCCFAAAASHVAAVNAAASSNAAADGADAVGAVHLAVANAAASGDGAAAGNGSDAAAAAFVASSCCLPHLLPQ